MIKRLIVFYLLLIAVSFTAFFVHQFLLAEHEIVLHYSLFNVYLFNVLSCTFICLAAELLSVKLPSQVGYAYLASVFVKMGTFVLLFKETIFNESGFLMTDRLSMVIPTMLFLIIEAGYCGRLMNSL
ncbi:MAG: hypothetical protein ACJAT1_000038 [Marivirga sp.]|jgi:hypothetical protein